MTKLGVSHRSVLALLVVVLVLLAGISAPPPASAGSGYLDFKVQVCKLGVPTSCKPYAAWQGFLPDGKYRQPAGSNPERRYEVYVVNGQSTSITYRTYTLDGNWNSYAFMSSRTCNPTYVCVLLDLI
jgi:hypothetical protein